MKIVSFGFLLFVAVLQSCKTERTKQYSRLKVSIESQTWFSQPTIAVNFQKINPKNPYPATLFGQMTYVFDSVENGMVTIILNSVLDTSVIKQIELTKDTIIYLGGDQFPSFVMQNPSKLDISSVIPGETICISRKASGCFNAAHASIDQKLIFKQKEKGYWVDFSSYYESQSFSERKHFQKTINNSFQDSLKIFQESLINSIGRNDICLAGESFYVRKGNKVYSYNGCINHYWPEKILSAIF